VQPASFLESVITRGRPLTLRALAAPALLWLQSNLDGLRPSLLPEQFNFLIDKSSKMLNRVQKGLKLELNSWSPLLGWFVVGKLRLNRTLGDQLLGYSPASSSLIFGCFLRSWC